MARWKTSLGIAALAVTLVAVIASGDEDKQGAEKSGGSSKSEVEEVTITACSPPDAIGVVYVDGEAENTSSERSDYLIEVAVVGPDGTQLGTGTAIAENVESGQKALWKALTDTPDERWVDGVTCKVVDVSRNASF